MGPLSEVSLVLSSRNNQIIKIPIHGSTKRVLASITHFVIFPKTQQEKSTQKVHGQPCLKWRLLPLRLYPWENVYCHGLNTGRALCWSPSGASWEYTRLCSSYFSATLLAGLDSKGWYLMSRSQPIVHLTSFRVFFLSPEHSSTAQISRAKIHVDSAKMSIQGSGHSDLIPRRYEWCHSARTHSLSCSSTCSAERTSHERPT